MAGVLTVLWFGAGFGGALAGLIGLFGPRRRRRLALTVAGGCFAVAGVLGILSIGIVCVGLSVASFVAAGRSPAHSIAT